MHWFIKVAFHNYANFQGRARRKEYWIFVLFYLFFLFVAMIVDVAILEVALEDPEAVPVLSTLLILLLLAPSLAVGARRMHDIGYSGWVQLIYVIPLIGMAFPVLCCKDGDPLENKYGPSPKAIAPVSDAVNVKSDHSNGGNEALREAITELNNTNKENNSEKKLDSPANSAKDIAGSYREEALSNKTKVFCGKCGKDNSRDNKFCTQCGQTLAS